jgi:hypothetical protein
MATEKEFLIVRDKSGMPFAFPSRGDQARDEAFYGATGYAVVERGYSTKDAANARLEELIDEGVAKSPLKFK